jgi:protocatechuate 3,4-dioxygenase beta subunit
MSERGSKSAASKTAAGLLITLLFTAGPAFASADGPPEDAAKKARLTDLWKPGDTGDRMNIRGRVTSLDGTPLAGIAIEIRQPDGDGLWTEQYRTTLITDEQGRYQFGSVVPASNYCGEPHVEVMVFQDGWKFFDDRIVFQNNAEAGRIYYGNGTPVFLEESNVRGEAIKFGRFDIVLSPE